MKHNLMNYLGFSKPFSTTKGIQRRYFVTDNFIKAKFISFVFREKIYKKCRSYHRGGNYPLYEIRVRI